MVIWDSLRLRLKTPKSAISMRLVLQHTNSYAKRMSAFVISNKLMQLLLSWTTWV